MKFSNFTSAKDVMHLSKFVFHLNSEQGEIFRRVCCVTKKTIGWFLWWFWSGCNSRIFSFAY